MKHNIHQAFHEITMPPECENRILSAIHQSKKGILFRPKHKRIQTVIACFFIVLFFCATPTVVDALENWFSITLEKERVVTPGQLEIRYRSSNGKFTDSTIIKNNGTIIGRGGNNLNVQPDWYVEKDSRLYFSGNGETIDVTELISMDTPFTYTYTDSNGIIHYICIGGVYDPDPEKCNVGYSEWYYDTAKESPFGWIGGYADNYWNKETDEDWPWLKKAKEDMGIPWR